MSQLLAIAARGHTLDQPGRLQQFVERRWVLVPLAIIIGFASALLLWVTLYRDYFDYWLYPKEKAADGYIYPQLRYTIFDIVLISWCVDGLIAFIMYFWNLGQSGSISRWTRRTLVLYFVLFAVLILGGTLMIVVRSHGY